MTPVLQKQAAEAIRSLQEENDELRGEINNLNTRTNLVFKLYKQGAVSAENIETLHQQLKEKTVDELSVMEKAAEFHTVSDSLGFSLSENLQDDGTLDPLTRMLLEDT